MNNISIKIPSLPSAEKVEMDNFLLIEQPEGTKKAKIENLSECLNKSELSSYINEEKLPEDIITVKGALDYILENHISNLTNKINNITTLTFYYGVSSESILSKEKLLNTLNSTDIFESNEEINKYLITNYDNFNFSKEEFTNDKYVYIAFPYILKDLHVINKSNNEVLIFDDSDYKIMTLPNSYGFSQEFYVKKSINTINTNKTFTLEFEKKPY